MFEIKLRDLIKEHNKLVYESTGITNPSFEIFAKYSFRKDSPKNIIKSMILSDSTIVLYFYNQYKCLCHNVEIRLNQMTFPTLKYEDYIETNFNYEAQNLRFKNINNIKVNFDPSADYMKNELFSKAVINCAKRQEKSEKPEKIQEK